MKKNRGILVLVLTAIITGFLVFTSAVGFGPTGTGAAKNIKTGLDLSGGVSITYEASKAVSYTHLQIRKSCPVLLILLKHEFVQIILRVLVLHLST